MYPIRIVGTGALRAATVQTRESFYCCLVLEFCSDGGSPRPQWQLLRARRMPEREKDGEEKAGFS